MGQFYRPLRKNNFFEALKEIYQTNVAREGGGSMCSSVHIKKISLFYAALVMTKT